jgi:hypothetical protein
VICAGSWDRSGFERGPRAVEQASFLQLASVSIRDAVAAILARMSDASTPVLPRSHGRRLREYYRSAGWPCQDTIEIDLLNAGLVERIAERLDAGGCERIRVTETGLLALGSALLRNRQAFDAHEALVRVVAQHQARAGRLVYRGLMLRGRVGETWKACRPDVYSIRPTSVAAYAHPVVHEVKVRRADLLSDLRNAGKRSAYQALSTEFFYVLPEGLAQADEVPPECGVLFAGPAGLRLARPSPQRAVQLGISEWMALARRGAEFVDGAHEDQAMLGDGA